MPILNPAGGAMIVVLLVARAGTAVSGWLLTTDAFWGSAVLQHVHSLLAHGVLALDEVQPEGKRVMTAAAWRAGVRGAARLDPA